MPIGGMIAKENFWTKFGLTFSMSASSFAGNALASRAALTTISVLQEENLINDCQLKSSLFLNGLARCAEKHSEVLKGVKGLGLLIGVETRKPQDAAALAKTMIRRSVLVAPAFGNSSVLIFEPPLVISVEQIDRVLDCFENSLRELTGEKGGEIL
jgi:acetylornithine/succinyldiaminopimelate/putrescine aminotransferase